MKGPTTDLDTAAAEQAALHWSPARAPHVAYDMGVVVSLLWLVRGALAARSSNCWLKELQDRMWVSVHSAC